MAENVCPDEEVVDNIDVITLAETKANELVDVVEGHVQELRSVTENVVHEVKKEAEESVRKLARAYEKQAQEADAILKGNVAYLGHGADWRLVGLQEVMERRTDEFQQEAETQIDKLAEESKFLIHHLLLQNEEIKHKGTQTGAGVVYGPPDEEKLEVDISQYLVELKNPLSPDYPLRDDLSPIVGSGFTILHTRGSQTDSDCPRQGKPSFRTQGFKDHRGILWKIPLQHRRPAVISTGTQTGVDYKPPKKMGKKQVLDVVLERGPGFVWGGSGHCHKKKQLQ